MLPVNKATSGPEDFPAMPGVLQDQQLHGPQSGPATPRAAGRVFCPACPGHDPGTGGLLTPVTPPPVRSPGWAAGGWAGLWPRGLQRVWRWLERTPRGLRTVTGSLKRRGLLWKGLWSPRGTAAGREGLLDADWAPEAEDGNAGVKGGGPGALGEAGGREEAPGGIRGPDEG